MEALRLQGLHALVLQGSDALVQPGEGVRAVAQGAGLLGFMHHVGQRQPVGREQPAVPASARELESQGLPGTSSPQAPKATARSHPIPDPLWARTHPTAGSCPAPQTRAAPGWRRG